MHYGDTVSFMLSLNFSNFTGELLNHKDLFDLIDLKKHQEFFNNENENVVHDFNIEKT